MQGKRPPTTEEEDAARILAQRRELNKQAQRRFRERVREVSCPSSVPRSSTHPHTPTHPPKAKRLEEEQQRAKQQQQEQQQQSTSSSSSRQRTASSTRTSAAPPSIESFAWLANTLGASTGTVGPASDAGLSHTQATLAAAIYGPDALAQYQRKPAVASPWPPTQPSQPLSRTYVAPPRAPYSEPAWMQPGVTSSDFNVAPSLEPGTTTPAAMPLASAWHSILEQHLQPLHDSPAATQQSARLDYTGNGSSSLSGAFSAADVTSGAVRNGGASGDSPGESSGSGSSGGSPESIETIGGSSHGPTFKLERGSKQYEEIMRASKLYRQANPLKRSVSEAMLRPRLSDGTPTNDMSEEAAELYEHILSQVLHLRTMTPEQFDEWLEPNVVRAENFAMPQSDFLRAMYRTAVSSWRANLRSGGLLTFASPQMQATGDREKIDDIDALSDIAASWSLDEAGEAKRVTAQGEASNSCNAVSHAAVQERQRKINSLPENLRPTKLQLEVPRECMPSCARHV